MTGSSALSSESSPETFDRNGSIRQACLIHGDNDLPTLRILASCLKAIPQTYRFGLGARYYRMDTLPFWVLLVAGLVLGVITVLKIIIRNNAV
jgi:hypothetical protein